MHFIGNNSLTLRRQPVASRVYRPLTLAYSAGFTVLSLVVSCVCMIGAFFVMGLDIHWDGIVNCLKCGQGRNENDGHLMGRVQQTMIVKGI